MVSRSLMSGRRAAQLRGRLDQDLRAFEPLDAPGEQQVEGVRRDAPLGPRPRAERRRERGQVNPRRGDVDLVVVGAVVRHQFLGLGAGVGNQAGGAVDDPVFAHLPPPRLRLFPGLEQQVLDLGHGVHGVDQRHAPQFRELQAGDARTPSSASG